MFFIYSEDLFLLNKQVKKIINKTKNDNLETEIITYSWIEDDAQKIIDEILSTSFFVDQKIIIVKDAYFLSEKKLETGWVKNDSQKIMQLLQLNNYPNLVIFTLNEPKISKKLKLTKEFEKKAQIIEVNPLNLEELTKFVQKKVSDKEKTMDLETIEYFLNQLPNDLQIINNELTKLINLNQTQIDQKMVEDNIAHYFTSDAYKISEYFQTNQVEPFIQEFQNYLSSSSDLIRLLYLLNTNITFARDCLILKHQGKNEAQIAELLHAHPYRVKMTVKKNNLTIEQLNDKILVLYDLNKLIVSGLVDPTINAEIALIKNMSI